MHVADCVFAYVCGCCMYVFKCKHKIYVKCLFDTKYLSQMRDSSLRQCK